MSTILIIVGVILGYGAIWLFLRVVVDPWIVLLHYNIQEVWFTDIPTRSIETFERDNSEGYDKMLFIWPVGIPLALLAFCTMAIGQMLGKGFDSLEPLVADYRSRVYSRASKSNSEKR